MSPKTLVMVTERITDACQDDPYLMDLSVVRGAQRRLDRGDYISALRCLQQDLDKIMPTSRDFGEWVQECCECLRAADRIEFEQDHTNGGRGSRVADRVIRELRWLDLRGARQIYGLDGDKVVQYPNMVRTIESTIVGCRRHGTPYYCPTCI